MPRTVFFISDHTCITAETVGHSLLSQFPSLEFDRITLPFCDSEAKVRAVCPLIAEALARTGKRPLVFSTLADADCRRLLQASGGEVCDLFDAFVERLEDTLGQPSAQAVGRAHGLGDQALGRRRVQALRFTLDTDDGLRPDAYAEAEIILVGVSRSGKTPACLYLALHYGIRAANYPLADEDLARTTLPPALKASRSRLFGLTLNPERLHRLREERRPHSRYASLERCREEVRAAEALFQTEGMRSLDTSALSVEEIATRLLQATGLRRAPW
jgi:regulator of PEP synthase PpsR (kinase-PPPase family)